jgi:hypothetical protein
MIDPGFFYWFSLAAMWGVIILSIAWAVAQSGGGSK